MTRPRNAALFVSSVLTLAACAGGGGHAPETGSTGPRVCDARFEPPAEFDPTETFQEEYPDRVGVRVGFADEDGRELHAFAGIPGEFGEGMPDAGTLELAGGDIGHLSGGPHEAWVVSWEEGGACDPHAVLGTGFDRRGFLAVLKGSGLLAS